MIEILTLLVALLSLIVTYIVYYNNTIGDVVVYAQIDLGRKSVINLVIHNIGKGVAKNITFICPDGVPSHAYGIAGLTEPKKNYESGAFVNGLPILFPDEKLVFSWGQFGGLKEALNGKPLELTVLFESRTALQVFKRKIKNKLSIDPTAFEGVDISTPVFESEVKKSLKEISTSLKKMAS
ncbi:hypothetical protein [Acinetobacter sp. IK40]|jgi:hypothetical protein|uniref:hypothetical protein n=1 Tax=Acinetobacter sp. IK40 TaxID=2928897 RepID=UPI00044B18FB|nr:hypothetical protein [Acinetobacter sp. IK40]EXB27168.1 hypothetical protein J537_0899 [Acinetobacter baumannii 1437282]MEB3790938.1 hypothetical protein [Acinetobacter sp. IK40]